MKSMFGEKKFGFGCMRLPLLEDGTVADGWLDRAVDFWGRQAG